MANTPSHKRIKNHVRQVYARLARFGTANVSHLPISSGKDLARALGYDTLGLPVPREAWGLFAGCGNPLEEIELESDWIVVDFGCGVGIDCQTAASTLRPPGKIIGIDITVELLRQAKKYARAQPACHWLVADGEDLPLGSASANLVIANGSFNLMVRKEQALAEIYRILKPGGYLALADLILIDEIEPITEELEEAWTWCVAGALSAAEYDLLLGYEGFSWWELKEKGNYGPLSAAHLLARKGQKTGR